MPLSMMIKYQSVSITDPHHDETQHNNKQMTLSIMTLKTLCCYGGRHLFKIRHFILILSVVLLNAFMMIVLSPVTCTLLHILSRFQ
jgi:hypothetical protein